MLRLYPFQSRFSQSRGCRLHPRSRPHACNAAPGARRVPRSRTGTATTLPHPRRGCGDESAVSSGACVGARCHPGPTRPTRGKASQTPHQPHLDREPPAALQVPAIGLRGPASRGPCLSGATKTQPSPMPTATAGLHQSAPRGAAAHRHSAQNVWLTQTPESDVAFTFPGGTAG